MRVEEVLEALLLEICEASRMVNAEIYAVGDTGWSLLNNNRIASDVYALNVAIKSDDINRVIDKLRCNNDHRAIESVHNNAKINGMYFRYVDIDTVCYDFRKKNRYVYNGIHINIWILKKNLKNRRINKLLIMSERCWECKEMDIYTPKRATLKMRSLKMIATIIWKIIGEKRGGKFLLKELINSNHKTKETYRFNMPLLKICKITNDAFKNCRIINFKGYKIKIFTKDTKIMVCYKTKIHNIIFSTIVNSSVSNSEYLSALGEKSFFSNKWYKKYAELIRWRAKKYLPIRRIVWDSWTELYFSYDRFNLWDYYNEQKIELLNLYYKEEYIKLEVLLSYYMEKLDIYDKKQKGLCFDVEILKLALTIYCLKGNKKKAFNIINNIRIEHFESVGEYEVRYQKHCSLNKDKLLKRKKQLQEYVKQFEIYSLRAYIYSNEPFGRSNSDVNERYPFECVHNDDKYILICSIKNDKCNEEYRKIHVNQTIEVESEEIEKIYFDAEYVSLAIVCTKEFFLLHKKTIYGYLNRVSDEKQYISYDYVNELLYKLKAIYLLSMKN